MINSRIKRIEWGRFEGKRPRKAGCNARLGEHGISVGVPVVRLTTEEGAIGFGFCWAEREQAEGLLGAAVDTLFSRETGVLEAGRAFECPLWDLAGKSVEKPVYALTHEMAGLNPPAAHSAPCYDTSLYFDDLHLATTEDAAQCLAREAREGMGWGHRAFKVKVGRGARHLPLEEGTERDIAIIRAVREAIGPDSPLLLDANNGYNLNLAKRVLAATSECNVHWLEEAFHEDDVLYRDLKVWQAAEGIQTLIADGEGDASPRLLKWARAGLIDVVQYDIFGYGFTPWLHLGRQLDAWGVRSAPHHYGAGLGNYVTGHLAGVIKNFTFVEWDETEIPGIAASGYRVADGRVHIPNLPGFGLVLDEAAFAQAVANGGGRTE